MTRGQDHKRGCAPTRFASAPSALGARFIVRGCPRRPMIAARIGIPAERSAKHGAAWPGPEIIFLGSGLSVRGAIWYNSIRRVGDRANCGSPSRCEIGRTGRIDRAFIGVLPRGHLRDFSRIRDRRSDFPEQSFTFDGALPVGRPAGGGKLDPFSVPQCAFFRIGGGIDAFRSQMCSSKGSARCRFGNAASHGKGMSQ